MRFTPWALALSLCATALLSACGGGSKSSTAQVRLLNATQSYAALDLSVNDKTLNTSIAYGQVGAYAGADTSATASKVLNSSVGTSVAGATPTLASGSNYTYIAYGAAGSVRATVLQENVAAPDANKSKLLVFNLAPDAGPLDVYVTTDTDPLDTATVLASNITGGASSGYNTLNSGTFRIRVTGYNKRSDLRIDMRNVVLPSAGVTTVLLTATDGGLLVNGMQLVQQGAVTLFTNTQSRVRTVAALGGGATVAASINNTQLLPTTVSPSLGEYVSTTAGASTLSVSVNGSPVTVASPTLKAGGDYTLLLSGTAASPQFTVLVDDNRLPATSGNVNMRMINALPATSTALTLNLDFTALASNVAPGTSSGISNVPSSTTSLLTVSSPNSLTPVYSVSALTLVANGVYTVFVLGDPATPLGILRRER